MRATSKQTWCVCINCSVVLVKKFYFSSSYSKFTEIPNVLVIVTVIPCLHNTYKPCQHSFEIIAKRNAGTPKQKYSPIIVASAHNSDSVYTVTETV